MMTNTWLRNFTRAKKHIGVTEAIAIVTLFATTQAVLFNVGFFFQIQISFLSLMNFQDILLGMGVATLLLVLPLVYVVWVQSCFSLFEGKFRIAAYLLSFGFPIVVTASLWIGSSWTRYAILVIIFFGIFGYLVYRRIFVHGRTKLTLASTAVVSLVFPIFLGLAVSEGILSAGKSTSTTAFLDDGTELTGFIIRTSSSYLFLKQPDGVLIIPLDEIKYIRRPTGVVING